MTRTYWIRPLWLGLIALGLLVLTALLSPLGGPGDAAALGGWIGVGSGIVVQRLKMGPDGVLMAGRFAAWSDLQRRAHWSGVMLSNQRRHSEWSKRVNLQPSYYRRDWRNSDLGRDIARWAPHLLDDEANATDGS